jgi:hypothetical protein
MLFFFKRICQKMYVFIFIILVLLLLLVFRKEGFTERFGFSGWAPPKEAPQFSDQPDISGYVKNEDVKIDNDKIQRFVKATQAYLHEKGLCAYIISTDIVEEYNKEGDEEPLYIVRFMLVSTGAKIPFGYGLTAFIKGGNVLGSRSQPMTIKDSLVPYSGDLIDNFLPASYIDGIDDQ